jgi:hypothetical protein
MCITLSMCVGMGNNVKGGLTITQCAEEGLLLVPMKELGSSRPPFLTDAAYTLLSEVARAMGPLQETPVVGLPYCVELWRQLKAGGVADSDAEHVPAKKKRGSVQEAQQRDILIGTNHFHTPKHM